MDLKKLQRASLYAGYLAFFWVLFFAFFLWGFPIERFHRVVEKQLSQVLGRDVKIGGIALSFTGDLVLSDVEIGLSKRHAVGTAALAQPTGAENGKPGEKPKGRTALVYEMDEIAIDIGLFAWLFGTMDVEIEAKAMGGEIVFEYRGPLAGAAEETPSAKTGRARSASSRGEGASGAAQGGGKPLRLFVEVREISLKQLIDLREMLPVPVGGNLSLTLEIASDSGSFADSNGKASFALSSLEFSRKGYETEFFNLRLGIPLLLIEKVAGELTIEKGECELGAFSLQSKHVEVKMEGGITLKDPLSSSSFDLYFMFRLLEPYIAQSDTLKTILPDIGNLSSDMRRAERDDGLWGFRYQGPWGFAKFSPSKSFTWVRKNKARPTRAQPVERSRTSRFRRRPPIPSQQVVTPPSGEAVPPAPIPAAPAPVPIAEPPMPMPTPTPPPPEPAREVAPAEEEPPPAAEGREEAAEKEESAGKEKEEGETKADGEERGKEEGDQKAEEGEGKEDQGGEKGGNGEEGKEKEPQGEGSGSQE